MTVYRHPSDIAGAHRLGIAVARAVLQGDGEADRLLAAMTRSEVNRAIKALSLDLADTASHKPQQPRHALDRLALQADGQEVALRLHLVDFAGLDSVTTNREDA